VSAGVDRHKFKAAAGSKKTKLQSLAAAPSIALVDTPHFSEIQQSFQTLEAWKSWSDARPELRDKAYIDDMARSIKLTGFVDPLGGFIHPSEVGEGDENYREGLSAHGLNSRYRAMTPPLIEHTLMNGRCSTIYLSEHFSSFADVVTKRFPYVMTSEYMPNPAVRRRLFQVRHEDPLRLTLPDHAFDLYLSSDQMVYAPSMMDYLKEVRRILRRTGQFIATLPFRYGESSTEIRAQIKDGEIVHRLLPEYRDDPLDINQRKLVFFIPGWDILDAAREAGFASAEIIAISSRTNAILGAEIAVVFVLRAIA
jgi:SAM-dependent methyltransferase